MTQLGMQPRVPVPLSYKGFHLIRRYGCFYGLPCYLNPQQALYEPTLLNHPAVLSAPNLEQLQAMIDHVDMATLVPQVVDRHDGYCIVRHQGVLYAVPESVKGIDLGVDLERRRAGVIAGRTRAEIDERIAARRTSTPVEFAGWLPIFEYSGNCGSHPQFTHTAAPPAGYHFSCTAPPPQRWRAPGQLLSKIGNAFVAAWKATRPLIAVLGGGPRVGLRVRCRVLFAVMRLFVTLLVRGAGLGPTLRFLQSRHFQSQLLLGPYRGLVFLTSMPYTYGQNPWVVEIEDPTTLFYPMIQNGQTCDRQIADSPYFPMVKALLESQQCKGILTHMKSTARMLPTLLASETIRKKVFYAPLGVRVPQRWQRHEESNPDELHLVFINSWCQIPENFYVRGGLDVLEAFAILRERYPQLRLTIRTHLPQLDDHYHRILETGWVRVIQRFMTSEEMEALLAGGHIFLLPAARVHIVSLLQAMSYGLAVVASDGWGMEEYLRHEHNGLVVKGRYGKTSWADDQAGMLRENYDPMFTSDPEVVSGIVDAVSRLVEDHELRRRLGQTARHDVETRYNMDRWNQTLKELFDEATGVARIQNRESRIQNPKVDVETQDRTLVP